MRKLWPPWLGKEAELRSAGWARAPGQGVGWLPVSRTLLQIVTAVGGGPWEQRLEYSGNCRTRGSFLLCVCYRFVCGCWFRGLSISRDRISPHWSLNVLKAETAFELVGLRGGLRNKERKRKSWGEQKQKVVLCTILFTVPESPAMCG